MLRGGSAENADTRGVFGWGEPPRSPEIGGAARRA